MAVPLDCSKTHEEMADDADSYFADKNAYSMTTQAANGDVFTRSVSAYGNAAKEIRRFLADTDKISEGANVYRSVDISGNPTSHEPKADGWDFSLVPAGGRSKHFADMVERKSIAT